MGPFRRSRPGDGARATLAALAPQLALAVQICFLQALLPGCTVEAPPSPFSADVIGPADCSGVTPSTNTCDTVTSWLQPPDFPDLPCPTRAEIEEIRRDIPVTVFSDVSAGVLACRAQDGSVDLTVVENQVYQSLLFLRRLRFDRPLPWTEHDVYDWVRRTIPLGIVIQSSGNSNSCLGCLGPVNITFTSNHSLWPTYPYLVYNLIVHEARHAEGWPHTCGRSETLKVLVRDKSVAEMGGFGVHYLLAYWIGHYSDEDPVLREYSSRQAARLLGGGSFCCECGAQSRATASLVARLFQQPAGQLAGCGQGQ